MSNETVMNEEAYEIVNDIIKDVDIAMLTTVSEGGKLVSRPLKTQEADFDGTLWFLTEKDTVKYDEIQKNPNVNVAYAGKSYVSVSGTAEFVQDLERKKEYWNPVLDKLLETSYDDPDVVLMKVTADTAEYWESGNKTKSAKKFIKKLTSSESVKDEDDLNKTVKY